MKALMAIALLLLASVATAQASEGRVGAASVAAAGCAAACSGCARDCRGIGRPCKPCGVIAPARCLTRPGAPCLCVKHQCATPLYPCGDSCVPDACHQPAVTCEPCGEVCVPTACHQPATPVRLEFCCECKPVLTGSRELISPACGCRGRAGGAGGGECSGCTADGWAD